MIVDCKGVSDMTFTFCIGYHTVDDEHVYLALVDVGMIPFAGFTSERDVRDAYIGVLVDGAYKERTITYERAIRLASLLDSRTR